MASPQLSHTPIERETRLKVRGRDVLSSRQSIQALIRAELGVETAKILAEPVFAPEGGILSGWRSPIGGALVPGSIASKSALDSAIEKIAALANRLATQGEAGALAAETLRLAITTPEGTSSFYMDQDTHDPVLVYWGLATSEQAARLAAQSASVPRPADIPPPPAKARTRESKRPVDTGSYAKAAAQQAPREPHRISAHRFAWYSLPWLLPLGLTGVLVWLSQLALEELPAETVEVSPPAPETPDPLPALRRFSDRLDAASREASDAQPRFAEACQLPAPQEQPADIVQRTSPTEPQEAPEHQVARKAEPGEPEQTAPKREISEPPPELAMAPDVTPEPIDKPAPPPKTARTEPLVPSTTTPGNKPPKLAVTPEPSPQKSRQDPICKGDWPPGRSPRMVFVVDGSGSMRDGIPGAASRMQAAKRSISQVVQNLHRDIRAAVVSFSDCGRTANSSYFSADQRGTLIGRVNAMQPGRKTSLASSIRRGGALATRRSETMLVVVSDGEDTCGADPCSAARDIKRAKPNIKINVIDLSDGRARGVLSCIAQAGGGRVYTPGSAKQMSAQMQRATGQPDASGCPDQ